MNKESEDHPLQSKVRQLEDEVRRLHNIIRDERNKNKELEKALLYFQSRYWTKKSLKDETQFGVNKILSNLNKSEGAFQLIDYDSDGKLYPAELISRLSPSALSPNLKFSKVANWLKSKKASKRPASILKDSDKAHSKQTKPKSVNKSWVYSPSSRARKDVLSSSCVGKQTRTGGKPLRLK